MSTDHDSLVSPLLHTSGAFRCYDSDSEGSKVGCWAGLKWAVGLWYCLAPRGGRVDERVRGGVAAGVLSLARLTGGRVDAREFGVGGKTEGGVDEKHRGGGLQIQTGARGTS